MKFFDDITKKIQDNKDLGKKIPVDKLKDMVKKVTK